jgi:hypothetical protein
MFGFVGKSSKSSHILLHVFQIRPIVGLFEECYGAFRATMPRKGPIMAFPSRAHPSASLLEHIVDFAYTTIIHFASGSVT